MIAAVGISDQLVRRKRINFAWLVSRCANAWRSSKVDSPAAWCETTIRLAGTVEAGGSRYDLDRRPWWREILECYADPEVREVVIAASTQVGKTLSAIAGILWCAENDPAPSMIVLPDRDAAIEFRDRVYANVESSQRFTRLAKIRIPPEHRWNTRWIDLGAQRVYLAWSGSRQRMRGRACRRVWLTEVDVYQSGDDKAGDPVAAAQQRTKAFHRALHYHESSPSARPSRIWELEETCTDRRRWHVRCPQCGTWQELRFFPYQRGELAGRGGFGGLMNDRGDWYSPEEVREHVHYVCTSGCIIPQAAKQQFVESGVWLSIGQKIDQDGEIRGEPPRSRRKIGFHLWALHSDAIGFADIASAYAEARIQGKVPEFWCNWLGLAYEHETKVPGWAKLGKKLAWTHRRGEVPRQAWFLTAGADVQDDRVVWSVRGWGPDCSSWLIDWGQNMRIPGDETEMVKTDLAQLNKILHAKYPIADGQANPLNRSHLAVRLLAIDSNYRPMDVHEWMRSLGDWMIRGPGARVRAVRGDHKVSPGVRYRMATVEQNTRTGERYPGGLQQWGVYVYPFYQDLIERLAGDPNKPGSWYVTADTMRDGQDYLRQVTNFHRITVLDGKTGRKKVSWQPRNNAQSVDFWDTEIYSLVAATMVVGNLGWSEQRWKQQFQPIGKTPQPGRRKRDSEQVGIADR